MLHPTLLLYTKSPSYSSSLQTFKFRHRQHASHHIPHIISPGEPVKLNAHPQHTCMMSMLYELSPNLLFSAMKYRNIAIETFNCCCNVK